VTSAWVFGSFFFSASARIFVGAAEDISAKQRNVRLQHAARKLRVCYTHTNERQTCDGMCVPTTVVMSKTSLLFLVMKDGSLPLLQINRFD